MNAISPSDPVPVNGENATVGGERERPPLDEMHFRFLAALHLAGQLAKEVDAADACDCGDVGHCAHCLIELVGHGSELVLENFFSMAEGATPHNVVVEAKALASTWRTSPLPESAPSTLSRVLPVPVKVVRGRVRKVRELLAAMRRLADTDQDGSTTVGAMESLAGIADEDLLDLLVLAGDRAAISESAEAEAA